MEPLPEDPHGWQIPLDDDGQWVPRSLADDTTLDPQPTKQAAVDAIRAHEADA